jgi:ubiquinone/menaquinone biosynthesis C-methylase UbiE
VGLWGRIFAAGYDRTLAATERAGLTDLRRQVVGRASGRVLEIGAGTGLNLPLYADDVELVLSEPEAPMAARLRRRLASQGRRAEVVQAPGERLPFPDGSFDTVVGTLVLCTVPDVAATLAEARRVLRPGGSLLFLEHVRSDDPAVARWQDRLHPLWVRFGHGCRCNRDTLSTLQGAGFAVEAEHGRMPKAPFWVRPLIWGTARVEGSVG